jgi:hypothetical protein
MEILKRTNRFYCTRPEGYPQIRVYHKEGSGKIMPRYLLKCGCCDEKLEIYYDDEGLEINGVNGSIEDWREILLPLLRIEKKSQEKYRTLRRTTDSRH